jgi:hypothetical protein
MKLTIFLLCVGIAFIVGPIWSGYVLSVLWSWFVVPSLHAPAISVAVAIGFALVVRFLAPTSSSESDDDKTFAGHVGTVLGYSLLYPAVALGFGAVVHMFM